jgi:outer membrane murein-binding lipoprotein Lpp
MGENKNSKIRKELKMTYSNSIAGSRQKYSTRNQNSTSFRDQARTLGPISNTIILIVLACLLGLLYLTQVTKTNTFSYQINSLETQQTQLQTQHDQLEIDATRLQSIERVASSPTTQQLASITPTVTIKN